MARALDSVKGMEHAADDYITKPFAIDYVVGKIKELLVDKDRLFKRSAGVRRR